MVLFTICVSHTLLPQSSTNTEASRLHPSGPCSNSPPTRDRKSQLEPGQEEKERRCYSTVPTEQGLGPRRRSGSEQHSSSRGSYGSTMTVLFHRSMDPDWDQSLTKIWTVSSPSPASLASIVNSTGRLAGTPEAFSPGPLARTLLASCAGKVLILKGLKGHFERSRLQQETLLDLLMSELGRTDLRGTSCSAYFTHTVYGPSLAGV